MSRAIGGNAARFGRGTRTCGGLLIAVQVVRFGPPWTASGNFVLPWGQDSMVVAKSPAEEGVQEPTAGEVTNQGKQLHRDAPNYHGFQVVAEPCADHATHLCIHR